MGIREESEGGRLLVKGGRFMADLRYTESAFGIHKRSEAAMIFNIRHGHRLTRRVCPSLGYETFR